MRAAWIRRKRIILNKKAQNRNECFERNIILAVQNLSKNGFDEYAAELLEEVEEFRARHRNRKK